MSPNYDSEAGARGHFLKFTPRKRRLVRLFESLARMVLAMLPSSPSPHSASTQPARILVIEYWNLGDLAILVPFLRNLRRSFPDARISLLVNASFASFLDGQGIVDEFIPIRVPWAQHFSRSKKYNPFSRQLFPFLRVVWGLRTKRFAWVFSGRMDIRDNVLMWLSGTPRRIGYGIGGGGVLLTDRGSPDLSGPPPPHVWLPLFSALGPAS